MSAILARRHYGQRRAIVRGSDYSVAPSPPTLLERVMLFLDPAWQLLPFALADRESAFLAGRGARAGWRPPRNLEQQRQLLRDVERRLQQLGRETMDARSRRAIALGSTGAAPAVPSPPPAPRASGRRSRPAPEVRPPGTSAACSHPDAADHFRSCAADATAGSRSSVPCGCAAHCKGGPAASAVAADSQPPARAVRLGTSRSASGCFRQSPGIALVLAAVFFLPLFDRSRLAGATGSVRHRPHHRYRAARPLRAEGCPQLSRRRRTRSTQRRLPSCSPHSLRPTRSGISFRRASRSGSWRSSPRTAVLLSIRRDSLFIAVLGLLGGFATPAAALDRREPADPALHVPAAAEHRAGVGGDATALVGADASARSSSPRCISGVGSSGSSRSGSCRSRWGIFVVFAVMGFVSLTFGTPQRRRRRARADARAQPASSQRRCRCCSPDLSVSRASLRRRAPASCSASCS